MSYIESIMLGISLAAIPGPIFFEVVRRTLTRGFWPGALLSVGEFMANFTILMLTFFGIYNFLLIKSVKLGLFIAGGMILIWLGYNSFRLSQEKIEKSSKKEASARNSVVVGFSLAMASPLAIAVWISIGGAYLAQYSLRLDSFINIILLAFGVMLFFFALAGLIHFTRKKISTRHILLFSRLFGIVLICYGLYFIYQSIILIVG